MRKNKIIYWTSTGLLTALMLMSVGMYIFNHVEISNTFSRLGYPSYIIYPLAIAKILGLTAIWTNKSKTLKEWAYAGFFFDFVLAFFAHLMVGESIVIALIALLLLGISYFNSKSLTNEQ